MTTPPSQKDYGTEGDSALVPGTLRVFRNFMVDSESGHITPMNYHPNSGSYMSHVPYPPSLNQEGYSAHCKKYGGGVLQVRGEHKSPDVDCTCGFYASYDPATDFYPSFRWGRNYTSLARNSAFENYYVVRAVCEVSGTVVMGRCGVRAERMKIVAFAIDWDKYMKSPAMRLVEEEYYSLDFDADGLVWPKRRVEYDYDSDDRADVYDSAPAVADAYGVALYGSVDELYEAFPAEDVSHLVDTTPKPEPEFFPSYILDAINAPYRYGRQATRAQQAAFYATTTAKLDAFQRSLLGFVPAVEDAVRSAAKAMGGISSDFVILDEVETTKERALRLKKNRPAPPGSGIDRRRGKLR